MTDNNPDAAKAETKPAAKKVVQGYKVAVEIVFPIKIEPGGARAAEDAAFAFDKTLKEGVPEGGVLVSSVVTMGGAKIPA